MAKPVQPPQKKTERILEDEESEKGSTIEESNRVDQSDIKQLHQTITNMQGSSERILNLLEKEFEIFRSLGGEVESTFSMNLRSQLEILRVHLLQSKAMMESLDVKVSSGEGTQAAILTAVKDLRNVIENDIRDKKELRNLLSQRDQVIQFLEQENEELTKELDNERSNISELRAEISETRLHMKNLKHFTTNIQEKIHEMTPKAQHGHSLSADRGFFKPESDTPKGKLVCNELERELIYLQNRLDEANAKLMHISSFFEHILVI
jgi:DNA repair exonuclease SbcCD ATPase subunit